MGRSDQGWWEGVRVVGEVGEHVRVVGEGSGW